MKTCLTCGAVVADNAEVCPDCGMDLSSAPNSPQSSAPAPASPPSPSPASSIGSGSGFTVDFGFEAAPVAPSPAAPAPATPSPSPALSDDFEFGGAASSAGGTVALEPIPLDNPEPTPAPEPVAPQHFAQITLKRGGMNTSEVFRFGPGSIVGRFDPESGPVDVDLAPLPEASYVSRHHVEFRYDSGADAWFVKDMGSRNGTFWRAGGQGAFGRLSGEQAVQSGDEIALGNARFEFKSL